MIKNLPIQSNDSISWLIPYQPNKQLVSIKYPKYYPISLIEEVYLEVGGEIVQIIYGKIFGLLQHLLDFSHEDFPFTFIKNGLPFIQNREIKVTIKNTQGLPFDNLEISYGTSNYDGTPKFNKYIAIHSGGKHLKNIPLISLPKPMKLSKVILSTIHQHPDRINLTNNKKLITLQRKSFSNHNYKIYEVGDYHEKTIEEGTLQLNTLFTGEDYYLFEDEVYFM